MKEKNIVEYRRNGPPNKSKAKFTYCFRVVCKQFTRSMESKYLLHLEFPTTLLFYYSTSFTFRFYSIFLSLFIMNHRISSVNSQTHKKYAEKKEENMTSKKVAKNQ